MPAQTIPAGQPAPDFSAKDQNGNTVSLSDFRGRKLALFFYPEDDTPGCTLEACNLRDNYRVLLDAGFAVVGVSMDDEASHQQFIEKYSLPFPLLADTDRKVIDAYGVWGEKNLYGNKFMGIHRVTYVIDEQGIVRHVFKKVKTEDHAAQILALNL